MKVLLAAPIDHHTEHYIATALAKAKVIVEVFDYRIQAEARGGLEMNSMFAAKKKSADLTLVLKGELISPSNLEGVALWNFDSWYAKVPSLVEAARHAKVFLTPSAGLVDSYKQQGINAHYLPEAADPELHRPVREFMSDSGLKFYGSDVSFVGTVDTVPGRDEWLKAIGDSEKGSGPLDTQYRLKIWGSFPGKLSKPWHMSQRADGDGAHNCVVSSSKIMLDRTRTPEIEGAISARVYRTMAAGGFLLMRNQTNIFNYLPGDLMGLYESDENCIEVIGHYLIHPELRERMAKAGYEWTLAHATWDLRIEELLKLV